MVELPDLGSRDASREGSGLFTRTNGHLENETESRSDRTGFVVRSEASRARRIQARWAARRRDSSMR